MYNYTKLSAGNFCLRVLVTVLGNFSTVRRRDVAIKHIVKNTARWTIYIFTEFLAFIFKLQYSQS